MIRLVSRPLIVLLIAGLATNATAQGKKSSSGVSGSSGDSGSSGSVGTSGSSGMGSPGTSGTSGSGTGSSGSACSPSGTVASRSSSNTSGSSGDSGSSGSICTSGSSGSSPHSPGTSGTSGSASGSSGSGGSGSGDVSCKSRKPCLPTITRKCFLIKACGFSAITTVSFGKTKLSTTGKFGEGSFKIRSNTILEVCPPQCLDPGVYLITFGTSKGPLDSQWVRLEDPRKPTIVCERDLAVLTKQCVFIHNGGTGKDLQIPVVSASNKPSVIPDILALGIGDNFSKLFQLPGLRGKCVKLSLGAIPAHIKGIKIFFQSVVLHVDPRRLQFPLMTSNVCSTLYK